MQVGRLIICVTMTMVADLESNILREAAAERMNKMLVKSVSAM